MAGVKWQHEAALIDELLLGRKSPLARLGAFFVVFGEEYGVDGRLVVAIAGAETSFGTDPNSGTDITTGHNAWGYGPHHVFPTWREAILVVTRDLGVNYVAQGLDTIAEIEPKWVGEPSLDWTATVRGVYAQLGGNPDASVKVSLLT